MSVSRRPRPTLRLVAALGAVALGSATLLLGSPPASAADPVFNAEVSRGWEGDTLIGTLPECGPRNINGRGDGNFATWRVSSTLAQGAEVEVGTEWLVRGRISSLRTNNGNNGPDPLRLRLEVAGAAASVKIVGVAYPGPGEVFGAGDPNTGTETKVDDYSYEFDMNSNPGILDTGDGAQAHIDITLRATAEGPVTLPKMVVSGYDGTPKAGDFSCDFPVGFSWTVDNVDLPTSGADSAKVDARYSALTVDDRNGGGRSTKIPVLANDDDPEVAGGPGLPSQVRIRDWQPLSVRGGTVSCGTQAQKGTPTFSQMSQSVCVYAPPPDTTFGADDSFSYLLRSVSGKERFVKVTIDLRDNTAPVGTDETFGTTVNTAETFQLQPFDAQGDEVTCFSEPIAAQPNGSGLLDEDCSFTWDANPSAGDKTFTYRTCDLRTTLQNGQMGSLAGSSVTRNGATLYWQGSPDDLDASNAQRCRDAEATVRVLSGIQLPPNAGSDKDTVDAGYSGDEVGPYTVEIPVRANDVDNNGVDPKDPAFGGSIAILDGPEDSEGEASVNDADEVVFTPADGFAGPVSFTYRVCEDPLQQDPPLVNDPNTIINEGLGLCGVGTVNVLVVGNAAPDAEPDAALVSADAKVQDLDVSANDVDPEGTPLVCTAGALTAAPAGLVSAASIDAQCLVDVTPVNGADGVATIPYEVCDTHELLVPAFPASPYGADGRSPGAVAGRCATGQLTVTIEAPVVPADDKGNPDPDPTCVVDAGSTPGTPLELDVLANDSDTDVDAKASPLTVDTAGTEENEGVTTKGGTVEPTQGGVRYTPAAGFTGKDTFLYAALDTAGQACNAEVTVTVTKAAGQSAGGSGGGSAGGSGDGAGGGSGSGAPLGTLPLTGNAVGPREAALALSLVLVGAGLLIAARPRGRQHG